MGKFRVFSFLIMLSFSFSGLTQIFYFDDTETTLIKDTDQSPAHWYIEIFPNTPVDSVLRWKSDFVNIPSEWSINLDCQTALFPVVEHNDSADFVLWSQPFVPQKLIIGATLNDTPGNGTVYFDIYDPYNPQVSERIAFHFIISLGDNNSLEESVLSSVLEMKNGMLYNISNTDLSCSIFDSQGKTIHFSDRFDKEIDLTDRKGELVFIVLVDGENNHYQLKIVL